MIFANYSHKKFCVRLFLVCLLGVGVFTEGCSSSKIASKSTFYQAGYLWHKKTLKKTKFNNGDKINYVKNKAEWEAAGKNKQPAYCYYENKRKNKRKYGLMYNWYAVTDNRGLAPEGWSVPNEQQFDALFSEIKKHGRLNELLFFDTNTEINQFTLKAGGFRDAEGNFGNIGFGCPLWSSTTNNGGVPLSYHLITNQDTVIKSYQGQPQGGGYIKLVKLKY